MAALYILLPDAREPGQNYWKGTRAFLRSAITFQPTFRLISALGPITALASCGGQMEPDEMLSLLRQIDWAYPAKLLYRTESDHGWSFVTLGLSLREGEGREPSFLDGY